VLLPAIGSSDDRMRARGLISGSRDSFISLSGCQPKTPRLSKMSIIRELRHCMRMLAYLMGAQN
jgi:hypothetical protein